MLTNAALDQPAVPDWLGYIAEPRHTWPILLIFGVALYLVNLGGYPLYTKGEPREAVTVFDIVHGGGVILPQRAGVEIPSKPLLMHWMAALVSIVAGGVNEFSVRLPSAGLAIAGVIVCYFYVRRLFDDVTALFAALILATFRADPEEILVYLDIRHAGAVVLHNYFVSAVDDLILRPSS